MGDPTTADAGWTTHRSFAGRGLTLARAGAAATLLALFVGVVAGTTPAPSAVAVALLVPAALVDVREQRLPDAWTAAAAAGFVVAATVGLLVGTTLSLADIAVGGALMAGPLLALHLASPAAMGFGDVKVAVVLGMATGAVAWELSLIALTLAAGGAAAVGLVTRARTVPFGPFLVAGAAIALTFSGRWLGGGGVT